MKLATSEAGPVLVVTLAGSLDSRSSPAVQEQILALLKGDDRILLDLTDVSFVSSAGLRTMLLLYRQAQCLSSSVALVGLSDELHTVLSATGFLGFFLVAPDIAAGVEALRADQREARPA
jgi:anti-sigma B factor antagonist